MTPRQARGDRSTKVWEGRYIAVRKDGRWEWAERNRDIAAAVILAVNEGQVILVEQYRVPLGQRCLELPAGLVGDDTAGEGVETAAARELEEETGYRAERIDVLGEFCSSPGMTSERFTLVRAKGLTRVGEGGGVPGEDITVHRVPLDEVAVFVAGKRGEGVAVDAKVILLLAGGWLAE